MLTSYLGVRREREGPEGAPCHVDGHPSVADWFCVHRHRFVVLCSIFFVVYKEEMNENLFLMQWRITSDSYMRFRGRQKIVSKYSEH